MRLIELAIIILPIIIASIIAYVIIYNSHEKFCDYAKFDKSKLNNLLIQAPYSEDAFASNSEDYKAYLNLESKDSVVNINQHEQDSSSNPVKFIEF